MVMGLGVVLALIGYALLSLSRRIDALPSAASTTS